MTIKNKSKTKKTDTKKTETKTKVEISKTLKKHIQPVQKTRTLRHIVRDIKPHSHDQFIDFLDDYKTLLVNGKVINYLDLNIYSHIFNTNSLNCICEHIFKQHIDKTCKCNKIKTFSSQGLSGAEIHSIKCNINTTAIEHSAKPIRGKRTLSDLILKTINLDDYYLKHRYTSKNYYFLELDRFAIQVLINKYANLYLPDNTINQYDNGFCINPKDKSNITGYNLMENADLGDAYNFIKTIINSKKLKLKYVNKINLENPEIKYKLFMNCMLQMVLSIGHLQQSPLEFFHGDLKLDNYFVKNSNPSDLPYFRYKINNKQIKVKNMGFAVLISDFDLSSITLEHIESDPFSKSDKKYRIIPPILYEPLLKFSVLNLQKKYANADNLPDPTTNIKDKLKFMYLEDSFKNGINLHKFALSYIIPSNIDPSIMIYRAAGVAYFRNVDLYILFAKMITDPDIKEYIIKYNLNTSIMSFMSPAYFKELLETDKQNANISWSFVRVIDIFNKIDETMNKVFTKQYLYSLDIVNYKLFGTK